MPPVQRPPGLQLTLAYWRRSWLRQMTALSDWPQGAWPGVHDNVRPQAIYTQCQGWQNVLPVSCNSAQNGCTDVPDLVTTPVVHATHLLGNSDSFNIVSATVASCHPTGATLAEGPSGTWLL